MKQRLETTVLDWLVLNSYMTVSFFCLKRHIARFNKQSKFPNTASKVFQIRQFVITLASPLIPPTPTLVLNNQHTLPTFWWLFSYNEGKDYFSSG